MKKEKRNFKKLVTILITATMFLVVIPNVNADIPTDMIAYWNFDEGIGSVANDKTSNNNDGFLSGGKFGNALVFDGLSNYVSVPDTTLSIAGPFTVEAWIYRNALGDLDYVLSKDDGPGAPGSNYNLLSFSGNKLALFLKGIASGGVATKGTAYWDSGGGGIVGITPILVGDWHHVAGVYTGSVLEVYLDGVLDGSVPVTGSPYTNTADLWIGNRKYSPGYFNGKIDEVRISNEAITSFDLFNPPLILSSTVALWHFDESVGTTVYDETTNDNDGTIYGATWAGPTWTNAGKVGNALSFDGIDDFVRVPANGLSNNPMTVTWWMNTNDMQSVVLMDRDTYYEGQGIEIWLYKDTNDYGYLNVRGSGSTNVESDSDYHGEWVHVAVVFDRDKSIDIDTPLDLMIARKIIEDAKD